MPINNDYPRSEKARSPEPFPEAHLHRCHRKFTGKTVQGHNMFVVEFLLEDMVDDVDKPNTLKPRTPIAYWTRKPLSGAIYGAVMDAVILKKPRLISSSDKAYPEDTWEVVEEEHVAIKYISRRQVFDQRSSERRSEDPDREVAAMLYLKKHFLAKSLNLNNFENASSSLEAFIQTKDQVMGLMNLTRIMTVLDVLKDDQGNMYIIMPFCEGGDLHNFYSQPGERFTEINCRYWMKEILLGIGSLQEVNVCHRDISLENLILDASCRSAFIMDMGQTLRIPFENGQRFLTEFLDPSRKNFGKSYTTQPEILDKDSYDGYAMDLWAVGACLFLMLTGTHIWYHIELRRNEQLKFSHILHWAKMVRKDEVNLAHFFIQKLEHKLIESQNHGHLSSEAADLLLKILQWNPQDRLSLDQIQAHRWIQTES